MKTATPRTYTYEEFDAIVRHNLTIRAQLDDALRTSHQRLQLVKKQQAIINVLVSALNRLGWRPSGNPSGTRLVLDTEPVASDRPRVAFITLGFVPTGRPWGLPRKREDGQTAVMVVQEHFDYDVPVPS